MCPLDSRSAGIDFGVRQTRLIHVSEPPRFDEKFQFTLADADSYVNLVLWCKCPEVLDKGISFSPRLRLKTRLEEKRKKLG